MGAGASIPEVVPATEEEAKAAGFSDEEISNYKIANAQGLNSRALEGVRGELARV